MRGLVGIEEHLGAIKVRVERGGVAKVREEQKDRHTGAGGEHGTDGFSTLSVLNVSTAASHSQKKFVVVVHMIIRSVL